MADAAELVAGETVLEIGPGTGMLTREFLKRGARVIAVEADRRAIAILEKSFSDEVATGNLVLHHGDIREITPADIGLHDHTYKLIANIPYYLSGILFRTFLESSCQPSNLVFLVQKEVAARITCRGRQARDKKESLLSLSVKVYGEPTYVKTVSRGNFNPQPKVDSAIIAISNISRNNFARITEENFFTILHLGFAAKRKQLIGNLSKSYERTHLMHIFSMLSILENARGEDLPLEIWLRLVERLTVPA